MITGLIIGAICGAVLAMRYLPKLKFEKGKITFEYTDTKNNNNGTR